MGASSTARRGGLWAEALTCTQAEVLGEGFAVELNIVWIVAVDGGGTA